MTGRTFWVLLLALLAGGGVLAWQAWQARLMALPPGIASGNGRIESVQVDVTTKESGRVEKILVREGDMVHAGQTVAKMDTVTLEAELARAEATVAEQEAKAFEVDAAIAVRPVVGMDKDVRVGLVVWAAVPHEFEMLLRDGFRFVRAAVGRQGRVAAELQPEGSFGTRLQGGKEHLLVIAHERNQPAPAGERQELVEDATAVGTAVDVVAERHDLVPGRWANGLDQRRQGQAATMDVADGDGPTGFLVVCRQTEVSFLLIEQRLGS